MKLSELTETPMTNKADETTKATDAAGRLDGLVRRLRQHALPDPHDEREVLHAPLMTAAADALEREKRRADWFERRCSALQHAQRAMRDPERKMVCDILANGITYVTPNETLRGAGHEP